MLSPMITSRRSLYTGCSATAPAARRRPPPAAECFCGGGCCRRRAGTDSGSGSAPGCAARSSALCSRVGRQKAGIGRIVDQADALRRHAHRTAPRRAGWHRNGDHALRAHQAAAEAVSAATACAAERFLETADCPYHGWSPRRVGHQQRHAVQAEYGQGRAQAAQEHREQRRGRDVLLVLARVNGGTEIVRQPGERARRRPGR